MLPTRGRRRRLESSSSFYAWLSNHLDSTHSGIRQRTRRVTNWKNGEMALRWSAVAFVETEKNYRRITGYEHLWMLKAHLDRDDDNVAEMQKVG